MISKYTMNNKNEYKEKLTIFIFRDFFHRSGAKKYISELLDQWILMLRQSEKWKIIVLGAQMELKKLLHH